MSVFFQQQHNINIDINGKEEKPNSYTHKYRESGFSALL
jgi:hypothetical protein